MNAAAADVLKVEEDIAGDTLPDRAEPEEATPPGLTPPNEERWDAAGEGTLRLLGDVACASDLLGELIMSDLDWATSAERVSFFIPWKALSSANRNAFMCRPSGCMLPSARSFHDTKDEERSSATARPVR